MSDYYVEKTAIVFKEIIGYVGEKVEVELLNGDIILLPMSQAERHGGRIFIPTWLAKKMGLDTHNKH